MTAAREVLVALCFTLSACGGESSRESAPGQPPAPNGANSPSGQATPNAALPRPVPLTPTEVNAYRQEFAKMFRKPAAPHLEAGPAGTRAQIASLEGHAHATVATISSDGKLSHTCTDDPEVAMRALTEPRTELEVK